MEHYVFLAVTDEEKVEMLRNPPGPGDGDDRCLSYIRTLLDTHKNSNMNVRAQCFFFKFMFVKISKMRRFLCDHEEFREIFIKKIEMMRDEVNKRNLKYIMDDSFLDSIKKRVYRSVRPLTSYTYR